MSGRFLVLSGRRSACNWLQQCRVVYLYKNVVNLRVHCAAQYCVSVKDKNKNLSQVKEDFEYKNVGAKSLHANIKLKELTEQSFDEFGEKHGKYHRINKEAINQKRIERLYPDPKSSLVSIYTIVGHELNDNTVLILSVKNITVKRSKLWEVTFNVKWPEVMSFKEIGKSKIHSSKNAAWKCLQWLEINGKLRNGKPIIYTEKERRNMRLKPIELNVTPEILNDMSDLIKTYNTEIQSITLENSFNTHNTLYQTTSNVHPILRENAYTDIYLRNKILKDRLLERHTDDAITLPIHEFKDEILSKLKNNRVLLIEGDTGCGKTTQVPQFILDSFTQNGNATDCNILISQPRRISAMSLADRIASERKEDVGDVVGFHVRLEQVLPKELGAIVFCTTGILLRKLQSNPGLEGCSHIILDEAHERQVDTDMLMILLKRALKKNPNLKVLIMSATINAHMFQRYFNCPAVRVPGRLYSVKMHFLEDIEHLPNIQRYRTKAFDRVHDEVEVLSVDLEKIVQIIKWISTHKPPGAILCFLPGWHEITKVQSMLEDTSFYTENHVILPMHSKISHNEQRKIFEPVPPNVRKIILATDIAETGITVSDVVYVVDSVIKKESRWDDNKNLPCISNRWISRANVLQRKGRAGRVKPGESYHLISKEEYEKLEAHPIPQLLCNPLDKVILDSKTYTNEKAEEFLGGLLEPPTPTAIRKAVKSLVDLGVIDNKENLTALGKRMALFPTLPKFSKAMVYSSIFNCIHPVITIASIFSGEDNVFYNVLDEKFQIRENKKLFHPSSDHIAMAWIFKQWFTYNEIKPYLTTKFCRDMRLRPMKIQILSQIRNTFIQQLIQCRLLAKDSHYDYKDSDIVANKYENNDELVRAVLYSATQQLIEHKDIGFKNGVLRTGVNELRTQGRAKVVISGESVNYKRKVWPSSFLTYFNAAHCEVRRSTVVRETSMISPLTVLLFNQRNAEYYELDNNRTEIVINVNERYTLRFVCDKETANVLLKFRDIMWSVVQYLLETQGFTKPDNDLNSRQIFEYKEKLFKTLTELMRMSAEPIEDAVEKTSLA